MTPARKLILLASETEFRRFFWAGSFSFFVDFSLLFTLTEFAHLNYLWSNLVSVTAGLILNYLLCIKWVFVNRRYSRVEVEFPIFVVLSIIGLSLNELLLWASVEHLKIHYLAAKIIVTLAVFVVNFFLKKVVLFRH